MPLEQLYDYLFYELVGMVRWSQLFKVPKSQQWFLLRGILLSTIKLVKCLYEAYLDKDEKYNKHNLLT